MLEVSNLDVSYGHAKVLHGVSLEVKKGETVFLVGRNGAGKTTLLRTIMGLLKATSGSITYDSLDVTGVPPEKMYSYGFRYVAQEKKVFDRLTVRENIEIAAFSSKESPDVALKRLIGLYPKMEKFLDIKAGQLSGGQRQILLLGRALVGSPKSVLVDEPTQGLAAIVIEELVDILSKLKGEMSAIIVEQNLSMVSRLADKVYIMREGKIEKEIQQRKEIERVEELESCL